jgi:2-C-methyl-D-erythritol 2,4-cyclodiphosphate synthase
LGDRLERSGGATTLEWITRSGVGYDIHRLKPGRRLILGGVEIAHPKGLDGHSDADVVSHAIGDALLGALALGDLGQHFPPGDPSYRDISSLELLRRVAAMVRDRGGSITGVDVTLVAESPALAPHVAEMRARLASALGIEVPHVSVKAKTNEGLGDLGRGEAMAAHAVATVRHPQA